MTDSKTTTEKPEPDRGGSPFNIVSPYDGIRLVGTHWSVSKVEPTAVVLILHGSGEHCGRYKHVAHFLNDNGMACVAYDMRGHGKSGGERGFVPHIDALLDDLECVVTHIRDNLDLKAPLVIYAHGTGCVSCIAHTRRRGKKPLDCQAMILSTPSICLKTRPSCILFVIVRAFSNLSPHFRLPLAGNYSNKYTNDATVVEAYRKDPLVHDRWPSRSLCIFLEVGYQIETHETRFPIPIMVQHGVDDDVTPIEGIRHWANERVKAPDVTFKEWPDHLHELHNDLGKADVLNHALDWIKEHLNIDQPSDT